MDIASLIYQLRSRSPLAESIQSVSKSIPQQVLAMRQHQKKQQLLGQLTPQEQLFAGLGVHPKDIFAEKMKGILELQKEKNMEERRQKEIEKIGERQIHVATENAKLRPQAKVQVKKTAKTNLPMQVFQATKKQMGSTEFTEQDKQILEQLGYKVSPTPGMFYGVNGYRITGLPGEEIKQKGFTGKVQTKFGAFTVE